MRLGSLYTQDGKGRLLKQLLEHCLEYNDTQLASCSMFGENLLFNDSLIGWMMLTNAQYCDQELPHVSIVLQSIKMQKTNQISPFMVQKYYRMTTRNVALHTPFYYYISSKEIKERFTRVVESACGDMQILKDVLSITWTPIQRVAGQYNDFNFAAVQIPQMYFEQILSQSSKQL